MSESPFGRRMVIFLKKQNNNLSKRMFEEAGFKIRNGLPDVEDLDLEEFESYIRAFNGLVKFQIDNWRRMLGMNPDQDDLKVLPLTASDEKLAKKLHDEFIYLQEGTNPRPDDFSDNEVAIKLYDEAMALIEKYKEALTEDSYAYQLIEKKAINRRIIKDTEDWATINFVRAGLHCLFDRTTKHGDVWKTLEEGK